MIPSLTGDGDSLTVTPTEITALSILVAADWELRSRQRFQKLVFLLDEELGDRASLYSYKKYDYGPYAPALNDDLASLESKDLVRIVTKPTFGGDTRYTYRLTERGEQVHEALVEESDAVAELDAITQEVVAEYGEIPVSNLIAQVRDDYPEYWENSVYFP